MEIVHDREFAYGVDYILRFPVKATGNVEYGIIERVSEVKKKTVHFVTKTFEWFSNNR